MQASEQQIQISLSDDIDWVIEPYEDGPFKKEDIYLIVEFTKPTYPHFSLFSFLNVNTEPSYKNTFLQSEQCYQPQFKYLHASQIDTLKTTKKGLISFESPQTIYFIRLDKVDENYFTSIFLDHEQGNKLKTGKKIREFFQKNSCNLSLNMYNIPTSYGNHFTTINAISNNNIGFFDHAVHFKLNTPCEKIKQIHSQISQLYIEYFNLNLIKEKPIKTNEVIQRMNAISTHVNSIILKGKVSARKIIKNLPKHIHEIILSTDFELDGSLSFFVQNIPDHVQQIGIEANTNDIKRFLDYFSHDNYISHIRAIRLFQGVNEEVIKEIPKHFTTIYLTPNTYVSKFWLKFVLDNLQLKKRDFLSISYPLGLLDLNLFQDTIPAHLADEKIHFIQHLAPEHTPRFIEDKPFNLYTKLLLMPGVKKQTLAMMQKTYKDTEFEIIIYPGLDADILKNLSVNMRNFTFCLSGKSANDKSLLRSIPNNFIFGVNFSNGSDPETAQAISYSSFTRGITVFISEMTNTNTMQAFFNRLTQNVDNRPIIESIDITISKKNKKILQQIPDALVKKTEFKVSTFDIITLETLQTKASCLTFTAVSEPLPDDTRKNIYTNLILTFKKFSRLKEINFKCGINHQILQGVASVPSVEIISLYEKIEKTDEENIKKFINVLKVLGLGNNGELIFYNNKAFCDKLMAHNLMKTANLKFRIFLDEELLYDPSKHNKQVSKKRKLQQLDDKEIASPSKRQKISSDFFSLIPNGGEESDNDIDITLEMSPETQAFMKN